MRPTTGDEAVHWPWRVGTQVLRTIYANNPALPHPDGKGGVLIGVMDTPELAREVVEAHNERLYGPEKPTSHE